MQVEITRKYIHALVMQDLSLYRLKVAIIDELGLWFESINYTKDLDGARIDLFKEKLKVKYWDFHWPLPSPQKIAESIMEYFFDSFTDPKIHDLVITNITIDQGVNQRGNPIQYVDITYVH
ncbi:MAG: hypothetical protein CMP20_10360 [Rickettsiales bacterium]|nr:hypothetical protein [Rickettsiales bacterium]